MLLGLQVKRKVRSEVGFWFGLHMKGAGVVLQPLACGGGGRLQPVDDSDGGSSRLKTDLVDVLVTGANPARVGGRKPPRLFFCYKYAAKSSAFLGYIFPLAGSSSVGRFSSFSGRAAHISDVAKIAEGQAKEVDGELSKSLLENNKCYLLDCGSEVYVWVGRVTQVEERKAAMQAAEEFITSQNQPKSTRVTRLIQGYETHSFKSNFESWPSGSAPSAPEESRGKVTALLKQQGVGLKGLAKSSTTPEEVPPLLEENGKIEVWQISGSAKTPVAKDGIGKFYSGDCYIVLYTYHSNEKKEDYYLCCWIGKDNIKEDHNMAARLATTMFNSLKGRPVQGGLSSGYKNYIADKGLNDETYSSDEVALIQISGTSVHNNKAVQVEAVATSLNSYDCFLLQSGLSLFTWHGNQSTVEQYTLAAKIAKILKHGVNVKFAKEGTENSTFWFALGGKQGYTSKNIKQETVRGPHLFAFSFNKGFKLSLLSILL
ncbi:hypothetical protein R6Q57_014588 [Mikania cordata]